MWMTQEVSESNIMYLSIVWGNLVQKSEEGVPGVKKREYELKDGTKGVKFEKHHRNLTGTISKIEFVKTDFGEQLALTLVSGEDTARLAINTDSRYFADFGKKLPNINLDNEVELNPFDFVTSDGKQLRGLSIKQEGEKITDNYWDGKKNINGMPSVAKADAKTYDSDDWKAFFIGVKKFLKAEIQKVEVKEVTPTQPVDEITAKDVFKDDWMPDF